MYFSNNFIIYSILGFLMESTIYKFKNLNIHSGILFGPYTLVYGFGILVILIINKIFKNIKLNKSLKLILLFLTLTIFLTIVEWLGGNILHLIFDIDMWNYSNHKLHFGKYISLKISIIWGILGLLYIYILKPLCDKFIEHIPKHLTKITLFIIILDSIITLFLKAN